MFLFFTLEGHRYPIINSGDTIALRSAYTSGSYSTYWLWCHTSYCAWTNNQSPIITSTGWSSWTSYMKFTITAKGKTDGEAINSGDTVSLSSNAYGSRYRLYCSSSSSSVCCANSYVHTSPDHNKDLSQNISALKSYIASLDFRSWNVLLLDFASQIRCYDAISVNIMSL